MPETQPFISINWTLVIQLFNTLLMYLFLKSKLFGPIKKFIDAREAEVRDIYSEAENRLEQAKTSERMYAESLRASKTEAGEIVKSAAETAERRSEEIVAAALEEAARIKAKAAHDLEGERARAMGEVKGEIVDISLLVASKFLKQKLDSSEQTELLDRIIDSVGDVSWKV